MKAVAWAIVWTALFYGPEISQALTNKAPSSGAVGLNVVLWLVASAILIYVTFQMEK